MNIKKIAITAAAAGMMLSAAVPALAAVNIGVGNGDIEQSNSALVSNRTWTSSNSGRNLNLGGGFQSNKTGNANSASVVKNDVNLNVVDGCGCNGVNIGVGNGDIEQSNGAFVSNKTATTSNTGGNKNIQLTRNFLPVTTASGATFLPGGLIFQYGAANVANGGTITFTKPFPTAVYVVIPALVIVVIEATAKKSKDPNSNDPTSLF